MKTALILAAGTDPSFKSDIPKQFTNIDNIPIIVYTMQTFQGHKDIDRIIISCLSGWEEMVRAYAKQFDISKMEDVITGGVDAQESIRRGVEWIDRNRDEDDIVIIHDAIRPLVSEDLITDSIEVCERMGMGVSAIRSMDTVMLSQDGRIGDVSLSRNSVKRIQTPQSYKLDYLVRIHKEAELKHITNQVDNNSIVTQLGDKVYFSKGSDFNIKINTVEDVEMFKALYKLKKSRKVR